MHGNGLRLLCRFPKSGKEILPWCYHRPRAIGGLRILRSGFGDGAERFDAVVGVVEEGLVERVVTAGFNERENRVAEQGEVSSRHGACDRRPGVDAGLWGMGGNRRGAAYAAGGAGGVSAAGIDFDHAVGPLDRVSRQGPDSQTLNTHDNFTDIQSQTNEDPEWESWLSVPEAMLVSRD